MEDVITLREFKRRVKKADSSRNHKVKNSLGIRDAFLFMQRNKWLDVGQALPEHLFQKVVREVNDRLAAELMEGHSISLPERMGVFEVRKRPRYAHVTNKRIVSNYYIDWDKTLKLWYEDKEAYENKTLVRDITTDNVFLIVYNRVDADYNNKSFILYRPNRAINRILGQNVKQHLVDAFSYNI